MAEEARGGKMTLPTFHSRIRESVYHHCFSYCTCPNIVLVFHIAARARGDRRRPLQLQPNIQRSTMQILEFLREILQPIAFPFSSVIFGFDTEAEVVKVFIRVGDVLAILAYKDTG